MTGRILPETAGARTTGSVVHLADVRWCGSTNEGTPARRQRRHHSSYPAHRPAGGVAAWPRGTRRARRRRVHLERGAEHHHAAGSGDVRLHLYTAHGHHHPRAACGGHANSAVAGEFGSTPSAHLVLRVLAEDVGKALDEVLDAILKVLARRRQSPTRAESLKFVRRAAQ